MGRYSSDMESVARRAAKPVTIRFKLPAWLRPHLETHNLLGPDIICSVSIDILSNGSTKTYCTKWVGKPEAFAQVVQAVVGAGVSLGQQHGISIEFKPQPPPQGGAHV